MSIEEPKRHSIKLQELSNPIYFPFSDTEDSELEVTSPRDEQQFSDGEPLPKATSPPGEIELERPILCGFLKKKGEQRRSWKKRWFVLRAAKLSYYKNEKEYETLNLIPLQKIHSVSAIELEKRQHVFGIVTKERTFYLQASTKAEMESWIEQIRSAVRTSFPETRLSVLSSSPLPPTIPPITISAGTPRPAAEVMSPLSSPPRTWSHDMSRIGSTSTGTGISMITVPSLISTTSEQFADSMASSPAASSPGSILVGGLAKVSEVGRPSIINPSPLARSWSQAEADIFSESDDDFQQRVGAEIGHTHSVPSHGTPQASEEPAQLQGLLYKYKIGLGGVRSWKHYWFVVRAGKLLCYKDESEYEVRRIIVLAEVVDVLEVDPIPNKGKTLNFCFKLVLSKKSWILAAKSEEERGTWVRVLANVAGKRKQLA
ncbi:hypothetical protein HDU91_002665 [Kappamyces sp. JEL0680]|nr:hypothetical protein HDU91_002665 [Kappamyces sp. JEL0680]